MTVTKCSKSGVAHILEKHKSEAVQLFYYHPRRFTRHSDNQGASWRPGGPGVSLGGERLKLNIAVPEPTSVLCLSVWRGQCGAPEGEGGGWSAPGRPCCCWCAPPWGSSTPPSAPWGTPPSPSLARGPSTVTPGSPEVSDREHGVRLTPPGGGGGVGDSTPQRGNPIAENVCCTQCYYKMLWMKASMPYICIHVFFQCNVFL